MATTRLIRTSRPSYLRQAPCGSRTRPSYLRQAPCGSRTASSCVITMRLVKTGFNGEKKKTVCEENTNNVNHSMVVAAETAGAATAGGCFTTVDPKVDRSGIIDLGSLLPRITNAIAEILRPVVQRRPYWRSHVQNSIERFIVDCRFFTLFAVAGSLLGSTLCFLEGCFSITEAYLLYFSILSQSTDGQRMVHLLIEAIDMFLVGTAMLIFGLALYVMFVRSNNSNENHQWLPESKLFGLYHLKALPTWVGMKSVSEAKSKIGHAVVMILQVGLLEKFKSIPLVTSFDLSCFAGAVFISSACTYVLSKLSLNTRNGGMQDFLSLLNTKTTKKKPRGRGKKERKKERR